ncbi:MAG: hypothetical protein COA79_03415 [Planctomycetota bacterium]|nr:MAG: hypothetical protein COA79_03415 [Planctomycetota bacterium]
MKLSFWCTQSEDINDASQFLNQLGYKIISSTQTVYSQIICSKLWHRKYLFFGPTQSVMFQHKDFLFLLEETPGTLFYSDISNIEFTKKFQRKSILFFHYQSSKSAGLKTFENGKLTQHIQSEIDYEICNNSGIQFSDDEGIEKASNKFNENSLVNYLNSINLPIPLINQDSPVDVLTMTRL